MTRKSLLRRWTLFFVGAGIVLLALLGAWLLQNRQYRVISMAIAVLSCLPLFLRFERDRRMRAGELAVIATMIAVSVLGRAVFGFLPGFKPVTAIVILTGMALGAEAGFVTGSMSAILSNIFFGHGPWTPFQMMLWGGIGLFAGLLFAKKKKVHRGLMIAVGILGGVVFSLGMDIWSVFATEESFTLARYLFYVSVSFPQMLAYAISNVIFLLLLHVPILKQLNRIKTKYGIFSDG
ncbi:MAG: ECF transporter S component [Clostridia bacterium]|nr:ECF transporter S component [Clostridia bacterium]